MENRQNRKKRRREWSKIVRKAQSARKEEGADGLEDKAEVRGEPVSCSDSVWVTGWFSQVARQKKPRGLAAILCCFPPSTALTRLGT